MFKKILSCAAVLLLTSSMLNAQAMEKLPDDHYFKIYNPVAAPAIPETPILEKGDQLAIIGDSITEQKMYSRIIETYLTVCVPQYEVSCRQFGWGGETAEGFRGRMKNDCLRFNPTIATSCYGMNDHRYEPYSDEHGNLYRECQTDIVRAFKAQNCKFIIGSAGKVGFVPFWQKFPGATLDALNQCLCQFRNICVKTANQEDVYFADVFVNMIKAEYKARKTYSTDYKLCGDDGIHPDWAGHVVMAYSFLKAMGLDGNIGKITLDMNTGKAKVSEGHEIVTSTKDSIEITSYRYPFCAEGEIDSYKSIRSGMTLCPFNQDLNRFTLKLKNCTADQYNIKWGEQEKTFTRDQLEKGINLADEFQVNPFTESFKKTDEAIAQKQNYETRQIKDMFHNDEAKTNMDMVLKLTEETRAPKVQAVKEAFKPVTHKITIIALT